MSLCRKPPAQPAGYLQPDLRMSSPPTGTADDAKRAPAWRQTLKSSKTVRTCTANTYPQEFSTQPFGLSQPFANQRLTKHGIGAETGSPFCTFRPVDIYKSVRRTYALKW